MYIVLKYYNVNNLITSLIYYLYLLSINIFNLFVLAVKVKPRSVKHGCSDTSEHMEIPADKLTSNLNITYSYSVKFEVSKTFYFLFMFFLLFYHYFYLCLN